ncbi:MAG TPA: polyhydroxyalkanoate synthesis regulator DNA-binding domain-containing protein [Vicinamibacteria bacterium]|nr:polyhydroxyalkanoate synthesis regulator DNA-binding domain-containing protein [Vicinamibacteria bacterium]
MPRDEPSPAPREIRRYSNRKLYDTGTRRYVTLDDLARTVAGGEDVQVLDQATGEDLTRLTLAQVLLEGVKRGASRIPHRVLVRLIRLAAGPVAAWGDWPEPRDAAGHARLEAERIVSRVLGRGRLSLDDAVALRQELGQMVHRFVTEAQAGVESRLRAILERGEDVAGRSLEALRGRIEAYMEKTPPPPAAAALRGGGRRSRKK